MREQRAVLLFIVDPSWPEASLLAVIIFWQTPLEWKTSQLMIWDMCWLPVQLFLIFSFRSCPFLTEDIFWMARREAQAFLHNKLQCGQHTQLTRQKSPANANDVSLNHSLVVFRDLSGKKCISSWAWPYLHCSLENSSALFCLILFYLSDLSMGQEVVQCLFQISKETPNIKWCIRRAVLIRKMIWDGQHSFTKGWSCLTYLVACCDGVMTSVNKVKAREVIYLDLYKVFDIIPQHILISKSVRCGFKWWNIWWMRNWFYCHSQSGGVDDSVSRLRFIFGLVVWNILINDMYDGI